MNYYKVLKDRSDLRDIICYCDNAHGFEQYELLEGRVIDNWPSEMLFYYNPDEGQRITDCLLNDLGWFVVSSKFKNLLHKIGGHNIQYFPVHIINRKDGSELLGYSVANVLNVINAINLRHSEYSIFELDDEKIYNIKKYALNERAITDHHIYKLKGEEIPLFVSELVKQLIENSGISGCDFLEVKVV